MAINKVEFGNQTLMDITDTSATSNEVIEGQVFYAANGVRTTGTLSDATQSAHGLMSAADKIKLDNLDATQAVYTDIDVDILTTDWTGNGPYIYDWLNSTINTNTGIQIFFRDGVRDALTGDFSAAKLQNGGGVRFTTSDMPVATVPVTVRIINSAAANISAQTIGTSAVTGATTVEGALQNLQSNKIPTSEKGVANGVATLDSNAKVPASQLPGTATQSDNGLMSALDKIKLDNLNIFCKTTSQWNADVTFIPPKGSVIIYSDYSSVTNETTHETTYIPNIKIGDGSAYCVDLPFVQHDISNQILTIVNSHAANTDIHTTAAEKAFWNNKLNYEIQGEELMFNRL